MSAAIHNPIKYIPENSGLSGTALLVFGLLGMLFCTGCAALTNPVAHGVPVRRLPPELLAKPREELRTIPLTALRHDPPKMYRIGPGDVLGVYIEGVLPVNAPGQAPTNPPVYFPSQYTPMSKALPPAIGYPIPVGDDGGILLPLNVGVNVNGMTIAEAAEVIRAEFLKREVLQAGRDRIVITLMQPRTMKVVVLRQEMGGFNTGQTGFIATNTGKRGTGHIVDLPAYQNDVLSAVSLTGGLPGLDAYNNIIVFKGSQRAAQSLQFQPPEIPYFNPLDDKGAYGKVVNIPVRMRPGEPLPFSPSDVVLDAGDVVLLEARPVELFYTGGLLPAGEQVLPRDYDLDVVEAIAQVKGPLVNGAFNGSNLAGPLINPRPIGNPNPSLLTVIRRTPGGNQIAIRVDLNQALRDTRERLIVQASDVLILQETPGEAISRYFGQVFNFNLTTTIIKSGSATGTGVISVP